LEITETEDCDDYSAVRDGKQADVRLGSDIAERDRNVRFVPEADSWSRNLGSGSRSRAEVAITLRKQLDAYLSSLFPTAQQSSRGGRFLNLENLRQRKRLDKRAITYKDYKLWRKLNPLVFTTIVDENNRLIGFFDIFPLKPEAGQDVIAGRLTERSLKADHLVPFADTAYVTHLHIATIFLNPRQTAFSPMVAKEVLLLKMGDFIEEHYAPIETRTFTAFAQSRAGEALLKRCGFSMAIFSEEQHLPLYVLRPSETGTAILRFDRTFEFFSRESVLKKLDSRIENIELKLRAIIATATNGDSSLLPPHVNQKIDERLQSESNKSAAFDKAQCKLLPIRLEFCDLRELQDTILSKTLWPKFQGYFQNKETLSAKFGQLAELRNKIRHSRSVDQVTQKEGEASIIWFERVLRK
jgi:hypothetical protein